MRSLKGMEKGEDNGVHGQEAGGRDVGGELG